MTLIYSYTNSGVLRNAFNANHLTVGIRWKKNIGILLDFNMLLV